MHFAGRTYSFGPFRLESGYRTLHKGKDRIWLTPHATTALFCLVENAGRIVLKHELSEAVWLDVAVSDDSLYQVITELRGKLEPGKKRSRYIATKIRKGYEFVAPVQSRPTPPANSSKKDIPPAKPLPTLTPDAARARYAQYSALADGRRLLETLELDSIRRARELFAGVLAQDPRCAAAHIGLAYACFLIYESTRAEPKPDRPSLNEAEQHARTACALDEESADAWGILALVLHCKGERGEAVAAARMAVSLDPEDYQHHLRLGFVAWGGVRLRAALRALALCRGLAVAHWLIATVHIARGALDVALKHVLAGCESLDAQGENGHPFAAVGLRLLLGQLIAALDPSGAGLAAACEELEREIAREYFNHVFGRESCANAWTSRGAFALRQGRRGVAHTAFEKATTLIEGHRLAIVGLHAASAEQPDADRAKETDSTPCGAKGKGRRATRFAIATVDDAIAQAVALVLRGKYAEAARLCRHALERAEPGCAGWNIPVEPLLNVAAHPDEWSDTLAILRARAV